MSWRASQLKGPELKAMNMTRTETAVLAAGKKWISKNRAWKNSSGAAPGRACVAAGGPGGPQNPEKKQKNGGWGGPFPRWGRRRANSARAQKKNRTNFKGKIWKKKLYKITQLLGGRRPAGASRAPIK